MNRILIDLRDTRAYEHEHVEGAINVEYFNLHGFISHFNPRETKFYVYCGNGGARSTQAMTLIESYGFQCYNYMNRAIAQQN